MPGGVLLILSELCVMHGHACDHEAMPIPYHFLGVHITQFDINSRSISQHDLCGQD
jgi:hypothetical protein